MKKNTLYYQRDNLSKPIYTHKLDLLNRHPPQINYKMHEIIDTALFHFYTSLKADV